MYKVFINNKPLTFGSTKSEVDRNVPFIHQSDFDVAVDLLSKNTKAVHIYAKNIEEVWEEFKEHYQQIRAAGGVVLNDKNQMLWIYRLGQWDLPKGKMEKGENIETTALREVEEECGISDLLIQKRLKETYHMYFHKYYVLKITSWFEMYYGHHQKLIPQTEEGITEVRWFGMNQLQEPVQNTYGNIAELVSPYMD